MSILSDLTWTADGAENKVRFHKLRAEVEGWRMAFIGSVALCSKGRPGLITGRKILPWGESWVGIALDNGNWRWASRNPRVIAADLDTWLRRDEARIELALAERDNAEA